MVLWSIAERNAVGRLAQPKDICGETGLSSATVWRCIKKLEQLELVFKRQHGRYQVETSAPLFALFDAVKVRVEERRSMF